MKASIAVLILTILCISLMLGQQSVSLSVDKVVAIALQKNISVIQAQNSLEGQQSATTAAVGGLLPSLDLSASIGQFQNWSPVTTGTRTLSDGTVIQNSQGGYSRSYSNGAAITGTYTLFNGFANTSNVSRARSDANSSEYSLHRTEQGTILQAHTLFLNVYRTYELLKVNEDNLKRSKEQLEQIVESNKVGSVALADVYHQQVQVGTDEFNLIQAQANHESAKIDLISFLGTDASAEYTFDFTGIPTDIDTTTFASLNTQYADMNKLVSSAIANRPDYLASVENLNSTDASVTVARANYFPTINLRGNYGFGGPQLDQLMINQFTDYRGLSFQLSASLPIFNGFSTQNQVEQAQVLRRNADAQVKQNELQIRSDIRKALLGLEAAEKQVTVSQSTVVASQMDQQIASEKYHLGAGTLLDLLIATANYTNSMSNKVNAVTGYILAQKQVEYVLGEISK